MLDRPPPSQNSNTAAMRIVAIVVIAVFLLSALYRWNSRQEAQKEVEETVDVERGKKLCEVRARQAGLSGGCELVDDKWVPVDSE